MSAAGGPAQDGATSSSPRARAYCGQVLPVFTPAGLHLGLEFPPANTPLKAHVVPNAPLVSTML